MLSACGGGTSGQDRDQVLPVTLQARLVLSAVRAAPGDTVTADARSSTGNAPLSYVYEWGDGEISTNPGPVATHVYATTGAFSITLTVTDRTGSSVAAQALGVWSDAAPSVRFSVLPSAVLPGEPVVVDASASSSVNGKIVSYTFAISPGETRTQASPIAELTFAQPDFYAINVTVVDEAGGSSTDGHGVFVGLKMTSPIVVPTERASLFRTAPRMARDASGILYAIWFDAGGLAFSRSLDNGQTFEPQTTIVDRDGPIEVNILGSALAVSDDGVVHIGISWDATDFGYVRSTDGGATFQPIESFDPVDGFGSFSPSIAVSGNDLVTVSWVQESLGASASRSSPIATSSNGGETYTLMSALPAPGGDCNTSLAYDGSALVAAWQGAVDVPGSLPLLVVQVATSADGGATFSEPVTLDMEPNTFCPTVVAQHGHVAVFWIAGNIVENQRLMMSLSMDTGATWSAPVSATPSFHNAKCGNVTFDDAGNLYVAYAAGLTGQIEHWLRASFDGGRTFGPALSPSDVGVNADCPAINATAPGELELIWSEPRLDGTSLFEVVYASATMSIP
jgi:PKD repeat protein